MQGSRIQQQHRPGRRGGLSRWLNRWAHRWWHQHGPAVWQRVGTRQARRALALSLTRDLLLKGLFAGALMSIWWVMSHVPGSRDLDMAQDVAQMLDAGFTFDNHVEVERTHIGRTYVVKPYAHGGMRIDVYGVDTDADMGRVSLLARHALNAVSGVNWVDVHFYVYPPTRGNPAIGVNREAAVLIGEAGFDPDP